MSKTRALAILSYQDQVSVLWMYKTTSGFYLAMKGSSVEMHCSFHLGLCWGQVRAVVTVCIGGAGGVVCVLLIFQKNFPACRVYAVATKLLAVYLHRSRWQALD
jgi:hypothetical protein